MTTRVRFSRCIIYKGPTGRATTGLFHLDQVSGILTTTSNSFDRDIATGGTEEYEIEVRATDQGGLSVTQRITVTLLDVNDNAPEFPEPIYYVAIREDDLAGITIDIKYFWIQQISVHSIVAIRIFSLICYALGGKVSR